MRHAFDDIEEASLGTARRDVEGCRHEADTRSESLNFGGVFHPFRAREICQIAQLRHCDLEKAGSKVRHPRTGIALVTRAAGPTT